jgi:hypothetical protein
VQYDALGEDHDFVAPGKTVLEYDADRVRLELILHHRTVEELENRLCRAHERLIAASAAAGCVQAKAAVDPDDADIPQIVRYTIEAREQRLAEAESANTGLTSHLQQMERQLQKTERDLQTTRADAETHVQELLAWSGQLELARDDVQGQLDAVYASKTWRWTSLIRRLVSWLAS